jgi:hypothetical protein
MVKVLKYSLLLHLLGRQIKTNIIFHVLIHLHKGS